MRQEIGAREWTEITKKEGMVVWGIDVEGNPVKPTHVHSGIVPVHENHVDAGIVLILENHVDAEVTLILENHVDVRTVHVRAGMLTGF